MPKNIEPCKETLEELTTMMLRSTLTRDAKVFLLGKMLEIDQSGRQWEAVLMVRNLWNMVVDKQTENMLLGVQKTDQEVALEIIYEKRDTEQG